MPTDIAKNLPPKTVSADGNCLYNSISVSMTGSEIMCHVLRLLVAAELYLEADFYAQHPHFKECSKKHGISYSENALFALSLSNDYPDMRKRRDVVVQEAKATCNNTTYGALLQTMAIASGYWAANFCSVSTHKQHCSESFLSRTCKPKNATAERKSVAVKRVFDHVDKNFSKFRLPL